MMLCKGRSSIAILNWGQCTSCSISRHWFAEGSRPPLEHWKSTGETRDAMQRFGIAATIICDFIVAICVFIGAAILLISVPEIEPSIMTLIADQHHT
jgi:hypothetical protein